MIFPEYGCWNELPGFALGHHDHFFKEETVASDSVRDVMNKKKKKTIWLTTNEVKIPLLMATRLPHQQK